MKKFIAALLMVFILASPVIAAPKSKKYTQPLPMPASARYVASKNSEPFHVPSCKWAQRISKENAAYYSTRDDAIKDGHRPCKVCKP